MLLKDKKLENNVLYCDARHGTEFSGESPPWAELKRFTSLDKGKFVRACHEGS
ncbi:MAG: hypothetical protein GY821_00550 [Gammaproteobacteria bacterium]|nr:hypothetical protein [Gammaproteobacteria bacterium]